jgi:hypothetical protein
MDDLSDEQTSKSPLDFIIDFLLECVDNRDSGTGVSGLSDLLLHAHGSSADNHDWAIMQLCAKLHAAL